MVLAKFVVIILVICLKNNYDNNLCDDFGNDFDTDYGDEFCDDFGNDFW